MQDCRGIQDASPSHLQWGGSRQNGHLLLRSGTSLQLLLGWNSTVFKREQPSWIFEGSFWADTQLLDDGGIPCFEYAT